jgi:hypothetical protein
MANDPTAGLDVFVTDNGTTWSFEVLTDTAKEFIDENLHTEPWMWLGNKTLVVDHRMSTGVYNVLASEGLALN